MKQEILCFQVPAGLFVPSLAMGACIGRVFGICMEHLAQLVDYIWLKSAMDMSS